MSSGDVAADRRYLWGQGAAQAGDWAEAADLFAQAAEAAPHWALAWFALGQAQAERGERAAADAAFARAQALDADGALGAALHRAALQAGEQQAGERQAGERAATPAVAPPAYVRALFDQYAERFDAHLVDTLGYRGPQILLDALTRASAACGREARFGLALDLGCGSGLMAQALAGRCARIEGVDLSPRMIEVARRTALYAQLEAGELVDALAAREAASADLVIAADVFVYMGDLSAVARHGARVLASGGLFALTVQAMGDASAGADYVVGDDLRYAHSEAYLRRLAQENGFQTILLEAASTRRDRGAPIPGLVVVWARP